MVRTHASSRPFRKSTSDKDRIRFGLNFVASARFKRWWWVGANRRCRIIQVLITEGDKNVLKDTYHHPFVPRHDDATFKCHL